MYPGMRPTGQGYQSNMEETSVDSILASLSCYLPQDRVRISQDVSNLLFAFGPKLKPSRSSIILNDGTSHDWLKISGVVPITYMNNTYNIPIDLWVPEGYPRKTPQMFVTPTQDMMIRPDDRNVGRDGLVHLPYLTSWHPQRSNLAELVAHSAEAFSNSPPVFAKPKTFDPPPPTYGSYSGMQATAGASNQNIGRPPPAYPMQDRGPRVAQLSEEEKKRSLVAALEVKLQSRYQQFSKEVRGEMEQEFEISETLQQHKTKIEHCFVELEKQQVELNEYIRKLDVQKMKLYEMMKEEQHQSENEEDKSADALVGPADVWSRQLLQCVAESAAVDDTLYQLDKALAREVIDLKSFLKEVRKLARKQFMRKALAFKVMEKQKSVQMSTLPYAR